MTRALPRSARASRTPTCCHVVIENAGAVAEKDRFSGVLGPGLEELDGLAVYCNRAVVHLVLVGVGVADGALEVRVRRARSTHIAAPRRPPRRQQESRHGCCRSL